MTGEQFARSLMSPVPLDALWSIVQGGVPVDFILGLTLESLEGWRNLGVYGGEFQSADPEFMRTLQLLRSLQQAHTWESKLIRNGDQVEIRIEYRTLDASQESSPGE